MPPGRVVGSWDRSFSASGHLHFASSGRGYSSSKNSANKIPVPDAEELLDNGPEPDEDASGRLSPRSSLPPHEVAMTHDNPSSDRAAPLASRRDVLLASLAAGTVALPRWLERPLAAREDDKPQAPAAHPLDPLSPAEIADAVKLLRDGRKLGNNFRFVFCTL